MSTQTITLPSVIKIQNIGEVAKRFAPYRENFTTQLVSDGIIEFKVTTSGQALYYLNQADNDLVITRLADFDDAGVVINTPAKITITNTRASNTNDSIGFIPYRENFQYDVAAGDSVELTASTVGQVLYYLAQATTDLTVTQEEIEDAE